MCNEQIEKYSASFRLGKVRQKRGDHQPYILFSSSPNRHYSYANRSLVFISWLCWGGKFVSPAEKGLCFLDSVGRVTLFVGTIWVEEIRSRVAVTC